VNIRGVQRQRLRLPKYPTSSWEKTEDIRWSSTWVTHLVHLSWANPKPEAAFEFYIHRCLPWLLSDSCNSGSVFKVLLDALNPSSSWAQEGPRPASNITWKGNSRTLGSEGDLNSLRYIQPWLDRHARGFTHNANTDASKTFPRQPLLIVPPKVAAEQRQIWRRSDSDGRLSRSSYESDVSNTSPWVCIQCVKGGFARQPNR